MGQPFIAGTDHAFSFPASYFQRPYLGDWDEFLADLAEHWPTNQDRKCVVDLRDGNPRTGTADELRLTDRWAVSRRRPSIAQFKIPGSSASNLSVKWTSSLPVKLRVVRSVISLRRNTPLGSWKAGGSFASTINRTPRRTPVKGGNRLR